MVEGSIRSVKALAYLVNTLSDFDPKVVKAHKDKDQSRINQLASTGNAIDMNLYICINKAWHGFVLCAATGDDQNNLVDFSDVLKSPFDIPDVGFCWLFELCFENEQERMYKIRKEMRLFKDVQGKIQRGFYIGTLKGITLYGLQFAALRAAPHRYSVLLEDCVEFAKEFCVQALAFCTNYSHDLEEHVHRSIREATATGFTAEKLSRNIQSSGWVGNTFLGGLDVSSFISNRNILAAMVALVLFLLTYPIVVAVIVIKFFT